MPGNALDKIPVRKVGGTRDVGPWPEAIEDIERGGQYERPVHVDGEVAVVPVTVKEIRELTNGRGEAVAEAVTYSRDLQEGEQ